MSERGSSYNPENFFTPRRQGAIYVREETALPTDREIIYLNEGSVPFGIPDEVQPLLEELVNSGAMAEELSEYQNTKNLFEARKNIRKRFGISRKPYIYFSNGGSDEILERLTFAFHNPQIKDTRVIGIPPNFPDMNNYVDRLHPSEIEDPRGLRNGLLEIPLDFNLDDALELTKRKRTEYLMSLEEQQREWDNCQDSYLTDEKFQEREREKKRIDDAKHAIFYLCNPGNPKAEVAQPKSVEDFIKFCYKNGDLVVIDEVMGDVLPDEDSAIKLTEKYPNIIVLRSLSKVFNIKTLGYAVTSRINAKFIQEFMRPHQMRGFDSLFAKVFTNPEMLKRHQTKVVPRVEQINTKFQHAVKNAGFQIVGEPDPRVPFFLIHGGVSEYSAKLRRKGVVSAEGDGYMKVTTDYAPISNEHVRLSTPPSEELIDIIVDRMIEAKGA